ncbi:VanZ family protein [Hymenobacter daecheongensis]|uniref:VanZ family protein n=1 Tax=Hymenobacter daecheongensis TaxID=496053 RepID=UPI0009FC6C63|nr:VanZ family protein [Hymenobacter daecheongensis]
MPLTAPPSSRRRALVVLPLAWAALVLVLTLTPAQDMPHTPPWELVSFDTAAHAFVFWVLAVLSYFSARRQRRFPRVRQHAFALVLLSGLAFGALIELLQMRMALGRHGEWSDVISDGIGTGAGLLSMWALRRWWD